MSTTADLFDGPVTFDPDLRVSASWRAIPNPAKPGESLPWVKESFCGGYTITWSVPPRDNENTGIFLLWRRYPLVNGYRQTASLLSRHASAREARLAAAAHAESQS